MLDLVGGGPAAVRDLCHRDGRHGHAQRVGQDVVQLLDRPRRVLDDLVELVEEVRRNVDQLVDALVHDRQRLVEDFGEACDLARAGDALDESDDQLQGRDDRAEVEVRETVDDAVEVRTLEVELRRG